MRSLSIEVKTITPMFMHGAITNKIELRPPAFRGLMRYWFRAAMGGVIGDDNLEGLKMVESVLFGNTEEAGKIALRINSDEKALKSKPILPHKIVDRNNPLKNCLKEKEKFMIMLTSQQNTSDVVWHAGVNSAIMAITFGGFGQRARRGFGALTICTMGDDSKYPKFASMETVGTELANFIEPMMQNFNQLAETYHLKTGKLPQGIPEYPCASKKAKFFTGDNHSNPEQLLKGFMESVQTNVTLGGFHPRQASPLWAKPIALSDGSYSMLMTFLPSKTCIKNDDDIKKAISCFGTQRANRELAAIKGWNQ